MSRKKLDIPSDTIGGRIYSIRKRANLSQQKFADRIDSSSGHVSDLENNKALPGRKILHSIERVFKKNGRWVYTGEGPEDVIQAELHDAVGATDELHIEIKGPDGRVKDSGPVKEIRAQSGQTADKSGLWGSTTRDRVGGVEHITTEFSPPQAAPTDDDPDVRDFRAILGSRDPILIPALRANIEAFKRLLDRERQIRQVLTENVELKKRVSYLERECDELRKRVSALEEALKLLSSSKPGQAVA